MIDTAPLRRKLLDLAITGKLVPKQGEWRTVKLGEVADVQLGKMLDRGKNKGCPYQYLANINVRWGGFDLNGLKETLFSDEEVGKFSLWEGDLLMCEGGVPGRCAIWREKNSQIKYQKALHRIRPTAAVLSEYLQLYFEAIHNKADFTRKFTGSTIHHLPREVLVNQSIPLPPLAEQKAIVKRLEELLKVEGEIAAESAALDDLITAAKRKVLDLAIRGQLVPQDPADEPASELLKRIAAKRETQVSTDRRSRSKGSSVIFRGADRSAYETCDGKTVCIDDEIPFDIPDSWAWARLGAFISIIAGVSYQKGDVTTTGVRILRGGNIKEDAHICLNNEDVFLSQQYADPSTAIRKGDVVIVASTGSSTVIGRPAIASEDMPSVQIGAFLRILRAKDGSSREWLPVIVLGDYYRKHIREQSKGTSIKNLKAKYLDEMLIPLPPLAEQRRIVAKIEEVRELMQSLTK